jgi:hypothetical protein
MTTVIKKNNKRIVLIEDEKDGICELFGKKDELRPYGPNFKKICFECGMKDERETGKRMKHILFGEALKDN